VTFDFHTSTRIRFGEGCVSEAGMIAASLGTRALLVQGGSDRGGAVVEQLRERGMPVQTLGVVGEPTLAQVERGAAEARTAGCDVVLAIGGGSVIDAAKAIAALITNTEPARAYVEVVGAGQALARPAVPLVAIPTTAGTGAEVTRNAVLLAEQERVKVSLRSAWMAPAVALIDPELAYALPRALTASTGMDALTQCVEPFLSPQATPLSDAVAREGMRRAAGAIRRVVHDGNDVAGRRDMAIASLCSGIALSNAKLGAVHGFAAPLGGRFPVPHGVACARLLAPVMAMNLRALRGRAASSPALPRLDEVARTLTGRDDARADDAVAWLQELVDALMIPRLATYGVQAEDVPGLVAAAREASSMKGNPVVLSDAELAEVLAEAL
jgi:alcohol dehydrogenase class IV